MGGEDKKRRREDNKLNQKEGERKRGTYKLKEKVERERERSIKGPMLSEQGKSALRDLKENENEKKK